MTISLLRSAPSAWSFRKRKSRKHVPGASLPRGTVGGARKLPIQLKDGFGCTKEKPIPMPAAHSHLATDAKASRTRWSALGPVAN